jgi:carbon-monoxide dehydrogenase medium subunit
LAGSVEVSTEALGRSMQSTHSVFTPGSVKEAVAAVCEGGATPLAGATWIMRAPLRGEPLAGSYVALGGVADFRALEIRETEIAIGAAVTHAALLTAIEQVPGLAGLAQAAGKAANPAVREVATVGGNLCAAAFAASDLAPALIAAGAEVEIHTVSGVARHAIEAFLTARASLPGGWLLTRIFAPRSDRISAHVRLPLRKAGDYPVAIVSVSLDHRRDGAATAVRVAVGSVEPFARRWPALEQALEGRAIDSDAAAEAARNRIGDFVGRDGVEAPGWYRTQVLPSLVRSAFQSLRAQA